MILVLVPEADIPAKYDRAEPEPAEKEVVSLAWKQVEMSLFGKATEARLLQ